MFWWAAPCASSLTHSTKPDAAVLCAATEHTVRKVKTETLYRVLLIHSLSLHHPLILGQSQLPLIGWSKCHSLSALCFWPVADPTGTSCIAQRILTGTSPLRGTGRGAGTLRSTGTGPGPGTFLEHGDPEILLAMWRSTAHRVALTGLFCGQVAHGQDLDLTLLLEGSWPVEPCWSTTAPSPCQTTSLVHFFLAHYNLVHCYLVHC